MKDLGYGVDYKYAHSFEQNFVDQDYLPKEIKDKAFYEPGSNQKERQMKEFLDKRWKGKDDS